MNAGTVEMLFQDGEFFFLEMNTRLQVEHCVTEEITGLDLVAEQLRVASGEPLVVHAGVDRAPRPLDRVPHQRRGPDAELPAVAGHDHAPARSRPGPGVRWDGGYDEGDTISQYYDNLVGKLIVWAPDRDRAIERMLRALGEFEIEGVNTTIPAHLVLLAHADFRAARHSTKWVEDEVDQSQFAAPARRARRRRRPTGDADGRAARRADGARRGRRPAVLGAGLAARGAGRRAAAAPAGRAGPKRGRDQPGSAGGDGTVSAPMQGTIVKVLVEVGATVEVGQAILVLEAMKMENHINADPGRHRRARSASRPATPSAPATSSPSSNSGFRALAARAGPPIELRGHRHLGPRRAASCPRPRPRRPTERDPRSLALDLVLLAALVGRGRAGVRHAPPRSS